MDLCGPMRVENINRKKYILVIVDDYTIFGWVRFLRTKDETPEVIKFIVLTKRVLNVIVRYFRTDNGTKFVNKTLIEFSARTMLIFAKASMFLWAKDVATACYTLNRSLVHTLHEKAYYKLLKDIGIFIGYTPTKKAYRIYKKRTRKIQETVHVTFDELTEAMTSVQSSTGLEPNSMAPGHNGAGPEHHLLALSMLTLLNKTTHLQNMCKNGLRTIRSISSLIIGLKWVYKIKLNEYGDVLKNNARLVEKGYRQEARIDFEESFAPSCETFAKEMSSTFKMSMMRQMSFFLGLQVSQNPRGIFINQSKYALKILKKYGLESSASVDTPMVEKMKLDEDRQGKLVDPTCFRGMVGSLMYLSASRPDIVFTVCMCAQY
nr:retrovirus-related Pol polyprotein from transposon TNT 1-94 [Tanacetum cinerariifolium]